MEPPGPTLDTYKRVIAAHELPVDVEDLDDFNLLWIGPRTAKSIIAYGCGGGYVMPAFDAHFNILIDGYKVLKSNSQDVSVVVVNFGLCPTSPYPTQLREMVLAIQHLTKTRPADNIVLAGDSAGGNLMLALLLHINNHPSPKVPSYSLPQGQIFREALLISPGAPIIHSTPSMDQSPLKDVINPDLGRQLFATIKSTTKVELPNPWIATQDAPDEWWSGVPVQKVTVVAGGFEILKDDILNWSAKLKNVHDGEVQVTVYPEEVHEQVIIDNHLGVTEDKASTKALKLWFQDFKA